MCFTGSNRAEWIGHTCFYRSVRKKWDQPQKWSSHITGFHQTGTNISMWKGQNHGALEMILAAVLVEDLHPQVDGVYSSWGPLVAFLLPDRTNGNVFLSERIVKNREKKSTRKIS